MSLGRIDALWVHRVSDGDVASNAFVEPQLRKDAERSGQALLLVFLLLQYGEHPLKCKYRCPN